MEANLTFANVVLDVQAQELKDRLFTYLIPDHLSNSIFAGTQVLVPFGKAGLVGGYVISLSHSKPANINLKEIVEVIDPDPFFNSEYVDFLNWIADYYGASLADVVSAAIPSFLTAKIKKKVRLNPDFNQSNLSIKDPSAKVIIDLLKTIQSQSLSIMTLRQRWRKKTKGNYAQFYRILTLLREESIIEKVPEKITVQSPKTVKTIILEKQDAANTKHHHIINTLVHHGGQMPQKMLLREAKTTTQTLNKLASLGALTIIDQETTRNPLAHYQNNALSSPSRFTLSSDQEKVLTILSAQLKERLTQNSQSKIQPWLLHGVTGSGKTEIYLRLIEDTLKLGRTAVLLVPEIGLTPQSAKRLTERFGEDIALWHSALSQGERYDTWRRLKAGSIKVLLGARSAILVDMPKLGLIILDEEHDSSYKQTSPSPRYHAKTVAVEKANRQNVFILLGSATPDVAAYWEAQQNKQLLELPNRIFNQAFPKTKIIDMREEFANNNRSIFSRVLLQSLTNCFSQNKQAILLMNRRGYASHVFCRSCGYVSLCSHCSVALVYHQHKDSSKGYLSCHHCGFQCNSPSACPSCTSPSIKQYGLGTQRVEAELKKEFPNAKILRLDSDTATKRGAHEEILDKFASGNADVLIGTQMVSKGLDIEAVTLIGILAADAAFNMPDYRSTERGFQLLTQVSGRAGRGQHEGLVILQTYNSDMPALHWSQTQDYQNLYQTELAARKAFDYPPFSQLIRVVIASDDPILAERTCNQLAESLNNYLEELLPITSIKILGPAACLFEKLRGKYRMHLLIKNQAKEEGRKLITTFLKNKSLPEGVSLGIDVDATDLF